MIRAVACYNGIKREKNYAPSGNPLIDDIRERCQIKGITMPMLDKMSGTGTYFSRAGWIGKKPNYKAIDRAIKALGGNIDVEWEPLE